MEGKSLAFLDMVEEALESLTLCVEFRDSRSTVPLSALDHVGIVHFLQFFEAILRLLAGDVL